MAFTERQLKFTFSGSPAGSFSAAGLRAMVSVQQYTGPIGVRAEVKIWGLSLAQMTAYSTPISSAINAALPDARLIVEAGDQTGFSKVIDAPIFQSYIDFSETPDSAFYVFVAGIYDKSDPNSGQSWKGTQNAEQIIAGLCALGGYNFANNGAHQPLRNPSVPPDSIINQIEAIASEADFEWSWGLNNAVSIWPQGGTADDVVIDVGPATDPAMVGYPKWWPLGLIVTSLFNSEIQLARTMNVISSIPNAQGKWAIQNVRHELATMMEKGPWFTTAVLVGIDQ
jgi:hypothetical protein